MSDHVITCVAVAVLPQASVAVNVRITCAPAQPAAPALVATVTVGLAVQLSEAVGRVVGRAEPQASVTAAGTEAKTGACVSDHVMT